MNLSFRTTLRNALQLNVIWWPIKLTLGIPARIYRLLAEARAFDFVAAKEDQDFEQTCSQIFPNLEVLHGPFSGMKYPSRTSIGSTLYPKLLGSYEMELSDTIDYILTQAYTAIIDIGCAEGYYAVGLGQHFKSAKIMAFDINEEARSLCQQMAQLNDVEVGLGEFCDTNTLLEFKSEEKALIFCDCEGYEIELFTPEAASAMTRHDFLIETHDYGKIETTQTLTSIFSQTHECQIIESIDDTIKAYSYNFPELASLTLGTRRKILAEDRPQIMRWIFAKAKAQ
tara:strand:+ start:3590 stop:4441 length:852 start_codon:yes stop_codon:yes gene_type:complete